MSEFDVHILILCIVVFALLVLVVSMLLLVVCRQALRLISVGADDEKIKKEYDAAKNKKNVKVWNIVDIVIQVVIWALILTALVFTIVATVGRDNVVGDVPVIKTVNSSSMATKLESNTYLIKNGLDDQVSMNDLIYLEKLPSEEDVELYDIILYESTVDGKLVLHRVVKIFEVGEMNGNTTRLFAFQGDAVFAPDGELVKYANMKGIYRGRKIKGLGSFVRFMHSPAGYMCIAFAMIVLVATPLIDKKIRRAKRDRLKEIGYIE